ncbi:MAG: hypothetical protein ABR608_02485 [Pseudonocardiaceae bacterium]
MTELRPSRRRLLGSGVAVGVLLVSGPSTGCAPSAPEAPEGPDPLESPATRAESDVALAQAAAATHPALAAAATALAADRQAHATALRGELRRVQPAPNPTPGSSVPSTMPAIAGSDADGAREALARAVHAAQEEAAGLVATLPGYRAALLASVAACCASHAAMLP